MENLRYYDDYVKSGSYINDRIFTHFARHVPRTQGHDMGDPRPGRDRPPCSGYRRAFRGQVIYYSASGAPAQEGYHQVDLDTLLSESDILSIHAPLNEYTEGLMDKDAFCKMKSDAILLNLGRGPINQ